MRGGHFPENQSIENGEDVFAVGEHAFQHAVIHGIALGQPLPTLQHVRWNVNVFTQFLQRVAAQEEAVEKRRFVLGFGEIETGSSHMLDVPKPNSNQKKPWRASKILPACPRPET
jgi:hypothetical protein